MNAEASPVSTIENPVTAAVQRCLESYYKVLEDNPPPPGPRVYREDHNEFKIEQQAQRAFLRAMPFLDTWEHVLCGLACLQHAMLLGIIDRVDAGRHIHLLQLAISAYRPKPEPRPAGRPKLIPPLPPIGNLIGIQAQSNPGTYISPILPSEESQHELKEELTRRGIPLPTAAEAHSQPSLLPLVFALAQAYKLAPRRKEPATEPANSHATSHATSRATPQPAPTASTGLKAAS
jgi:hypothetical protein